ncbi:hypothetical protein OAI97_01245 [Nitrosopumilus sp.]|nr:hypothetical protein [Nitrosopumilus sp.]
MMKPSENPNPEDVISNFTSLDYVVLSCMHYTDLKTMIKINALNLVESCEKFFDCGYMKKMNKEPPVELKNKIQRWLDSIEYKQYTKNTNESLSILDKEKIRKIYSKLKLKPHDLSELTNPGIEFLENKEIEIKKQWNMLIKFNDIEDVINLKKSIDRFAISIPLMFSTGIANGKIFSAMFKTINVEMYDYLSENPSIHPIFLDYLN